MILRLSEMFKTTVSSPPVVVAAPDGTQTVIPTMVGANDLVNGTGGLVPAPATIDCYRFLRGDGTWRPIPAPVIPSMVGATSTISGSQGAVPAPTIGDQVKYLRGDGTWSTMSTYVLSSFTGSTALTSGVLGGVPAPAAGDQTKYLKGDGTWAVLPGYSPVTFTGSTASTAGSPGIVPAASAGDQDKYFKGDGTWSAINFPVVSAFGAASLSLAGSSGVVPAPLAGDQTKYLKGDGTWAIITIPAYTTPSVYIGSSAGLVPMGGVADQSKFLRGDGSWIAIPTYTATPIMVGATALAAGTAGTVPSPTIGDRNLFLKGDGSWGVMGLIGLVTTNTAVVDEADSVVVATGKLQAQVNAIPIAANGDKFVFTGSPTNLAAVFTNIAEKVTLSAASLAVGSNVVNFDVVSQTVMYYGVNPTSNFTINFRMSNAVALDSVLAVGQSVTCTLLVNNGLTAYYPTTISVDGSLVTVKWSDGVVPTTGNISSTDCYSFTIIKTAASTYMVLADAATYR
jgi:hypothetical protein